jgi:hypothetical protein
VLVVVAAVSAAAGAGIDHVVSPRDSRSQRRDSLAYPVEVRALGIDEHMNPSVLMTFGNQECHAARLARSDGGAALLTFKANHVASVYNANDQVAIEAFRTLFVATGHLLCPDVETTIRASSRPLL